MKKIWVHKAASFAETAQFDTNYYSRMSRKQRIETMFLLRELQFRMTKGNRRGQTTPRLRRVVTRIQQK